MPGTSEFAEIAYTLTDCVVAAYNPTANTYGTPAALAHGQVVEVEPEADQDKLRSYGAYARGLSVLIGAKLKVKHGGIDFSVLAILTGMSNYTSGLTPNQVRTSDVDAGGQGLPRFGLLGVAATDDGGNLVVGLRNCLLDMFPKWTLDGEANKFFIGDTSGYAFAVSGMLIRAKAHETASLWTAPTTGADFLAFFTSPA